MNIFDRIKKVFSGGGGQSFLSWLYGNYPYRDERALLDEYKNIVYACINVIAEEVGRYEPVVYRKRGVEKIPVPNHPFLTLLERPNPETSQFNFIQNTQSFIELTGEAFWYVGVGEMSRKPKTLDLIRPDRVQIYINEVDGSIKGYGYKRDDGTELPLDPDEVIHYKTFNPLNPYRGLGTVQSGLLYIDTENKTSLFQHNFISNQATPSGVLTLSGKVTTEAFNKIKKMWRERQSGVENAGKTLIIREADAKFEKIGLSLADLNLEALKKVTEERVREMFRVPKPLLGETDSTGLGRSNVEAIEYIFIKRTIEPKLIRLDDTLTMAIRRYYGDPTLYIGHKSQIPQDQEEEMKMYSAAVDKWMTRNEIREKMGEEPIDGGDTLYYGFNQVPLDQPIPSAQPAKTFGKIVKVTKTTTIAKAVSKPQFFEDLIVIEDNVNNKYYKKLKALLNNQEKRVIESVRNQNKQFEEFGVDEEEEKKAMTAALVELLFAGLTNSGELSLEYLSLPAEDFVLNQATRDAIFESTERLIKSFNTETAKKIQKQLAQGIANKESLADLTKRVESIYDEAKGFRAERIARSESHKAVNAGNAEGYRQAGIKQMRWRTRGSSCEFCRAMDGNIITIGQSFVPKGGSINGTDGGTLVNDYEDIKFADAHPNCNCYLEPVT